MLPFTAADSEFFHYYDKVQREKTGAARDTWIFSGWVENDLRG